MKFFLKHKILMFVGLMLFACNEVVEKPEYRIRSIIPDVVTPGETVTVFGVLPKNAVLSLASKEIETVSVPNGVQFIVPESQVAGDLMIGVVGDGVKLEHGIVVNPSIQSAIIDSGNIKLKALGWPADLAGVQVRLGIREVVPKIIDNQLVVSLPNNQAYGAIIVSLAVGARISEVRSIGFEATSVQGRVVWPGVDTGKINQKAKVLATTNKASSKLIVFGLDAIPSLPGLQTSDPLISVQATLLKFENEDFANQAFQYFQTKNTIVEYENSFSASDGMQAFATSTPVAPGAGQWHLPLLGLTTAWQNTKGEKAVVAVVDTGVKLDHPDLQANILPGHDFVDNDDKAQDVIGHGTHVAGLVAANGLALGIAPLAKILPVRVLRDLSGGSSFPVARGILWAAGLLEDVPNPNPAQIINLSLGSDTYSELIARAITAVTNKGVIVVAASGNNGGSVSYPAALPGVIAVTALAGPTLAYQPWYANKGVGITLTGYGGDSTQDQNHDAVPDGILSTDTGTSGYGIRMGTSMAAPQVSGLAALTLSSGIQNRLVKDYLAASATDLGPKGFDYNFGYGIATARVAIGHLARTIVVAHDSSGKILAFAPVMTDGTFIINNLPPGETLKLIAMMDSNNNTWFAESGEMNSPSQIIVGKGGDTLNMQAMELTLSDGTHATYLELQ